MKIAIIGGGFVGRSWAIVFARAEHRVTIYDREPAVLAQMRETVARSLDELARYGLLADKPAVVLKRIETADSLPAAVRDADYVQENALEQLQLKRELFAALDRHSPPDAILASSSSGLTCSSICNELAGRDRCIVAHPANPPHLLRAIEVVPAPFTAAATTRRTVEILKSIGQLPVVVGEIDGFVMNRLQAALANEALSLVQKGIADANAIDTILRFSLGPRWAFMGPFQTMDLNAPGGFADYASRYGPTFAAISGGADWPEAAVAASHRSLRDLTPIEELDASRVWRDRRLAALVAHISAEEANPL